MSTPMPAGRILYRWRKRLMASDLPSRAKLVGFVLSEHMKTDNARCWPGLRPPASSIGDRKGYATRYEALIPTPTSAVTAPPTSAVTAPLEPGAAVSSFAPTGATTALTSAVTAPGVVQPLPPNSLLNSPMNSLENSHKPFLGVKEAAERDAEVLSKKDGLTTEQIAEEVANLDALIDGFSHFSLGGDFVLKKFAPPLVDDLYKLPLSTIEDNTSELLPALRTLHELQSLRHQRREAA
jgi:hypothetical protein